jgi:hypothetical protein
MNRIAWVTANKARYGPIMRKLNGLAEQGKYPPTVLLLQPERVWSAVAAKVSSATRVENASLWATPRGSMLHESVGTFADVDVRRRPRSVAARRRHMSAKDRCVGGSAQRYAAAPLSVAACTTPHALGPDR